MSIAARRLSRASQSTAVPSGGDVIVGTGALPIGSASYAMPSDGTARYVSPTGANGNAGTSPAAPWQTFEYAAANTPAGGTIVLRAGVYHEGKVFTGTANNATRGYVAIPLNNSNITIQNYPGETVWFDGSSVYAGWAADGGYWSRTWTPMRRDLTSWASSYPPATDTQSASNGWQSLDNPAVGWTYVDYGDTTNACAARPERVWVDGVQLTQVASLADLGPGKFFASAHTNKIHIGTNPTGKEVRITDLQTLFNALGTGFTMRGIGIRRYAPSMPQFGCVKIHQSNAIIENCVFEDIAAKALSLVAGAGTEKNWRVSRCNFVRIGNLGINFGGEDVTIEDCRFEYCNDKRFNPAPDAGGWKGGGCRNVRIQRNLHYRTQRGKGGWFDVDCMGLTVVNNDYIEVEQRGQIYELARDILDIGNRHIGGGAEGIVLMDCENAEIWNASFYDLGSNRGQVMGQDTVNCTGISVLTDSRVGANASGDSRFSYHNAQSLAIWPTPQTNRYIMQNIKVRNCAFGPSNYWAYFQYMYLGTVPSDGGSNPLRQYMSRADLDRNYYNGHGSKQVAARTYPWVLQIGTTTPQNRIGSSIANLRSQSTTDGDVQEPNGIEFTDTDRMTAEGYLSASYKTAADALAEPIPSTVAALLGVASGTQLMGARIHSTEGLV